MASFQNQQCSTISLNGLGDFFFDFGVVQDIITGGASGSPFIFADLTHGGWLPKAFFDALTAGGGSFIIGVTFTFVFTVGPPTNTPTDIDGNGKLDVAFREIYYNDNFSWADDGATNVDVESVALHEASGRTTEEPHGGGRLTHVH